MKFMVIVHANPQSEAGQLPSAQALADMMKFNEELVKAGMLLDGAGLKESKFGTRIHFGAKGKRSVVDGPFTESKELVAGYWVVQAKSQAEVVEWFKRCPCEEGQEGTLEIRPLHEIEEFTHASEDVLASAIRMREQGNLRS